MLLLTSRLWKKYRKDCRKLKMNEEKRKSDGDGGLKVEEIRSSCDDHEMTRTSET